MRASQTQTALFLALLAVTSFVFIPRVWAIRDLYLDAVLRTQVAEAIGTVAEHQGWLVSDLEIRSIRGSQVTLHHRRHLRGLDPVTCHRLRLPDPALLPCDAR